MFGDYGYMEEGKLGKPYNFRLLKRLAHYVIPYKKTISTALLLSILITVFDLAAPYLTKIAIDKYIFPSWYRVDTSKLKGPGGPKPGTGYADLLEKGGNSFFNYISAQDIKRIDPVDLHSLRTRGIIGSERFYRISPGSDADMLPEKEGGMADRMADGSILVPYELLGHLSKGEILRVRAGDVQGVALIAAIFLVLLLSALGLGYAEYYLLEFTGQRIMQDIRMSLFKKMQTQAISFFDRHPIGRLVTRVTNDIENLNEMFKSVVITVFKDLFILTGILIVLLSLNWKLALICFALIPFIFGLAFLFSSMAREAFRRLRATVAKINSFLQERISGMQIIQMFAREEFQIGLFSRINHENYMAGMKQIRVFALFMPVMELFSSIAVALLIWHGGGKVIQEEMSLGSLVAFISYIQMFFKPIRDISEKYNIMQLAMASTERIFEFMDLEETIPEAVSPTTPQEIQGHLVFKDVSFGYKKGDQVLRHVSFEVRPGETVAIVGATGSGKTTIVNLVERFYDPEEGSVLLDGVDLREWPGSEHRNTVSLCMQDVFIFAGTIADNISLGRRGLGREAIRHAAETVNALSFIEKFPNGLDEKLGEGGTNLSAGQRQLLSFARALAVDPRLLVLDEATSNVDPETERLIQDAIGRISERRTTLIVAHRLSTIRNAHRILVMHRGRIREQGTHEELMAEKGIYFKLNLLQQG